MINTHPRPSLKGGVFFLNLSRPKKNTRPEGENLFLCAAGCSYKN